MYKCYANVLCLLGSTLKRHGHIYRMDVKMSFYACLISIRIKIIDLFVDTVFPKD